MRESFDQYTFNCKDSPFLHSDRENISFNTLKVKIRIEEYISLVFSGSVHSKPMLKK